MEPTDPTLTKTSIDTSESTYQEILQAATERFSCALERIDLAIIEMLSDEDIEASDIQQTWSLRAKLIENFVDSLEPSFDNPNPRPRVQFDSMIDKATIFEKVGQTVRYLEDLDAAETFALNNDFHDVAISIGQELDEKIQELGLSPEEIILKLRGIIEFSNRDYLRELLMEGIDYEDLIGNIYGMILDEGGDPDEVLSQLGVTE